MIDLKPAAVDDIPRLWALRTRAVRQSCASHYCAEQIDLWTASPAPESYVRLIVSRCAVIAEAHGELLGYAILDRQNGEVVAVFVEPQQAGKGIGKQLMQELDKIAQEERFSRLYLSSSLNAVDFYRTMGFVAIREEDYQHPSGIALRSVSMERVMPVDSVH